MPRRSIADLETPRVHALPTPARLRPSETLPEAARAVFDELVRSAAPDHFRPADRPLLEEMAVALTVTRTLHAAACDPNAPDFMRGLRELRDQQRLVASLARACRLAPSTRITKRGAASGTVPEPARKPWENDR